MKKLLATLLSVCLIITSVAVIPMSVFAVDENSTITVNDVASFNQAVKDVANGGTINIEGTIAFEDNTAHVIYLGSNTGKTYTITGGTLDFTAVNTNAASAFINVHDNITFENITLAFDSTKNDFLFACGYNLTIAESVTFTGAKVCFYGGRYLHHNTVNKDKAINATLLAGAYTSINGASHASGYTIEGDVRITVGGNVTATTLNGGGNTIGGSVYVTVQDNADIKTINGGGGTIEGNTYVTVKDNANAACDVTSHDMTYGVFGGGAGGTVKGSTNVLFTDNAKANYIWGGCHSSGTVLGGTNITMSGNAKTMSMYGGGYNVAQNCDANVTLLGGTLEQVFGGCQSQAFTGNITVKLLGGTVTRRVFGGCYNNADANTFYTSSTFTTHYSVLGNIILILDEAATVDFSYNGKLIALGNDHSLSAHSRRESVAEGENATVFYVDSAAQTKFAGKLTDGPNADGGTHEYTHCHSYAIDNNVITQSCTCGNIATANITADNATYTGEAINTKIEYSDNWEYDKFEIEHTDNVNVGTATATFKVYNNQTHSVSYRILKATQKAPAVKAVNNIINGLTTAMEYSTDGLVYTAVTDPEMTFDSGKYFVRYAAVGNNIAESPATIVIFGNGISANKVNALNGKTVEIMINMPTNSGISSLDLGISYNTDALTLDNVTIGNVVNAEYADGKLTWSGESTTKTGVLAKLTFTVSETAELGNYAIELSQNGFTVENGSVNVVEYVVGDINGTDGKINASDLTTLRTAIVNAATEELSKGADANGDGTVNTLDLIVIRQYLANYNYDTGESSVVLGGAK